MLSATGYRTAKIGGWDDAGMYCRLGGRFWRMRGLIPTAPDVSVESGDVVKMSGTTIGDEIPGTVWDLPEGLTRGVRWTKASFKDVGDGGIRCDFCGESRDGVFASGAPHTDAHICGACCARIMASTHHHLYGGWLKWARPSPDRSTLISDELRSRILEKYEETCVYCGGDAETVDHVRPRGGSEPENLVAACRPCNTKKGNNTPHEAGMRMLKEHLPPEERGRPEAWETCSDYGGATPSGEPCQRPAGWGTNQDKGKCRDHR